MPFLPLRAYSPRQYILGHYVTIILIVVNVMIFFKTWEFLHPTLDLHIVGYTLVSARLFGDAVQPTGVPGVVPWLTLVTHQFLHGGWTHLIFNMLFLWVFGEKIEDAFGHVLFLVFFLICGMAGGLLHALIAPDLAKPAIGASGAIAGILGGYLILFPRAPLLVLAFGLFPMRLPAAPVIIMFLGQNVIWVATGTPPDIAVWAHIGGFAAGAVLVILLRWAQVLQLDGPPELWNP